MMQTLLSFFVNQNSFMFTLITYPAVHIGFYVAQLQAQFSDSFSPYTGKPLEGESLQLVVRTRMSLFVWFIFMFMVHTYFVQKDLITYAIKNHMIRRQQTQFKSFFSSHNDPMFVINENGEFTFSNAAALVLFQRSGSFDVQINTKIFTFRSRQLTESLGTLDSPTKTLSLLRGISL